MMKLQVIHKADLEIDVGGEKPLVVHVVYRLPTRSEKEALMRLSLMAMKAKEQESAMGSVEKAEMGLNAVETFLEAGRRLVQSMTSDDPIPEWAEVDTWEEFVLMYGQDFYHDLISKFLPGAQKEKQKDGELTKN